MNRNSFFFIAICALPIMAADDCGAMGGGLDIPIGESGYCLGMEGGGQNGEVEFAGVVLHECVPYGYYSCDYDHNYGGAFGGETCQGGKSLPDAYSVFFTTSPEVSYVEIQWATDVMDAPASTQMYPSPNGSGTYEWSIHFLNPGYGSEGDRIDFKITAFTDGGSQIASPVVQAFLDETEEDVRCDSDGECSSSW